MSTAVTLLVALMGMIFSALFAWIVFNDLRALRTAARNAERHDRVLRRIETWSLTEFDRARYIAEVEEFLAGSR
jgi:hypothetical protein